MGQPVGAAAQLHDLVRSEGEPRWTAVVDALLAIGVVAWVLVLAVADPGGTLRVAVPFVLAAVVVGRVVVLVEHVQRWRELGLDRAPAPDAPGAVTEPPQASQAA